jgi:hypothetical protein
MRIVTTPMCKKILEFAEVTNFKVNKFPDNEEGDLAILMSENKIKMNSLILKLNTFSQIRDSIIKVSKFSNKQVDINLKIDNIFSNYKIAKKWTDNEKKLMLKEINSKIKLKIYSKFLKDIAEDMGFQIISNNESYYDFIVFPDYFDRKYLNMIDNNENKIIKIPSHGNVSLDPIKRTELRYSIFEKLSNE